MFLDHLRASVDHGALMLSKLRFAVYFGVIIPVLCTSMCLAQNVPAFPVKKIKLQYALDAIEPTTLLPEQEAVFTCLETGFPGAVVEWLKDGASLGSRTISTFPVAPSDTSKSIKRRSSPLGRRSSRRTRPHVRRAERTEDGSETSAERRDPEMQRRTSSVLNTEYTPHNVTALPQPHLHDTSASSKGSYLLDDKFFLYGNGSLRVTKFSDTSVGEYKCVVSDKFGSFLRRKFHLQIARKPQCSINPASQRVLNGTIARLKCATVSALKVTYTWFKDGKPLPQESTKKYTFLSTGVLQIFDIDSPDEGLYECRASSVLGTCASSAALIVSKSASREKLNFHYKPQNLSLTAQEDGVFECIASTSNAKYGWYKEVGDICPDGCPYEIQTPRRNNLLLKDIIPSKKGIYNCRAVDERSGISEMIHSTANLDVYVKPNISITVSTGIMYKRSTNIIKVHYSKSITLNCRAGGNPKATVHWMKDGVVIPDEEIRVLDGNHYLKVKTIRRRDLGYYQCIAENRVRSMSVGARMEVEIREVVPPPYDVTAIARSAREVFVQWKHPNTTKDIIAYTVEYGDEIRGGVNRSRTSLLLKDLRPYNSYTITVLAYTRKQTSEESLPVVVRTSETEPCGRVNGIRAVPVNSTAILVTWPPLPEELRCGIITYYKVTYVNSDGYDEIGAEQSMDVPAKNAQMEYVVISGLHAGTNYGIAIKAATRVGLGEESDFADSTLPEAPNHSCSNDGEILSGITGQLSADGDSVILEWKSLNNLNIESLRVSITDADSFSRWRSLFPNETRVTFDEVDAERVYIANISVVSPSDKICESHGFLVMPTDRMARPKKFVTDLDGNATEPGCIHITWKYVYEKDEDVEFVIRYSRNEDQNDVTYLNSSETDATLCGLDAWTGYTVAIAALSGKAMGHRPNQTNYSKNKVIWTAEEEPGVPGDMTCIYEGFGNASCNWQSPSMPNGEILSYEIRYGKAGSEDWLTTVTKERSVLLECFAPGVDYVVRAVAVNSAGVGQSTSDVTISVPRYTVSHTTCVFSGTEETSDQKMAIIIGASIAAICLLICVILLVCCVPTSRCLKSEKRFCLERKKKNAKHVQANGTSKQEEVIVIGSLKRPAQNGRLKNFSLIRNDLGEEQTESLLPNGNTTQSNGNHINGVKNGYAKHLPAKKNGIHKNLADNEEEHLLEAGAVAEGAQQETKMQNGKGGSVLLDSFVRSLTLKPRPMAVPETDNNVSVNNKMVLSVPIPKHTSKMGIYATSSTNGPESGESDDKTQRISELDDRHLPADGTQDRSLSTSRIAQ